MRNEAKKKWIGMSLAVILALSLSGCKESPEEEIVAGKEAERFEQLLQETGASAQQDAEESGENGFREFRHEAKFSGSDGKVTVEVDAAVKEWAGAKPVYRVAPHWVETKDLQNWAEVFFEGNTVYDKRLEKSRSEIEKEILRLKREMDEESLQEEYGADPEILEHAAEFYREQIALYEDLYETAPETVERRETSWEYRPSAYYSMEQGLVPTEEEIALDKTMKLKVEADVDGNTYEIWSSNRREDDFMRQNIWFVTPHEIYDWEKLSDSEESAVELVQGILDRLGMSTWKVHSCTPVELENHEAYYHILCQNSYSGMPVAVLPQLESIGGEEYAARYYYESLEFNVSNGKICFAALESPMDLTAVETENASVLSFEEIMERFQQQMEVQYTEAYLADGEEPEAGKSYLIRVNRIEQELIRIKIPDNEKEFYLVPAWNFYGTVNGQEAEREGGEGGATGSELPLLTLKAVYGTVINTGLGY